MAATAARRRRLGRGRRRRDSSGYVAILMSILMLLLFSMSAFAVDVGNWYLTGQKLQKAADAAALAGVPRLPGDSAGAFGVAQQTSAANGFTDGDNAEVTTTVDGLPTRLRVTVASTVHNAFGSLLGISDTTIVRTSVADFAGPVAMGSPCNGFGNDPDPGTARGASCAGVSGEFWANINSVQTDKEQGDRFSSLRCSVVSTTGTTDECSDGQNDEYDDGGYFYSVTVPEGLPDLIIEAFDPAWVSTGASCEFPLAYGGTDPRTALNPYVTDEPVRYGNGTVNGSDRYCTGDQFSGLDTNSATPMATTFEVRAPSPSTWDVASFPVIDQVGCEPLTFPGYWGRLFPKLNEASAAYDDYPVIAPYFHRWSRLCTITNPEPGEYLVRVGNIANAATGSNHYSLRAYSSFAGASNDISIAGREAMSMFSNKPSTGVTEFYLARVPSGSAGKEMLVELFDAGDSLIPGTVRVVAPPGSGVSFTNCQASGPVTGSLPTCSFGVNRATHNGKLQRIVVPVPSKYKCQDENFTQC